MSLRALLKLGRPVIFFFEWEECYVDDDVLGSQDPPLPASVRTARSLMWTLEVCDVMM